MMIKGAGETYHVVKNALVQLPFSRAALPQLVVAVVQAFPVFSELCQAVCVDVLKPIHPSGSAPRQLFQPRLVFQHRSEENAYCQNGWKVEERTYTLWAQRVTLRPSFMHSNSPRPGFSVLHCM